MESPFALLARSSYVSLTTFRRDGTPVATPVWVVRVGDELQVWTNPTAGKVKRIRRDSHVELAPCTRRGKPLGRAIAGRGRLLDAEELPLLMAALVEKYGWTARLTQLPNRVGALVGRPPRPPGGLAITLGD